MTARAAFAAIAVFCACITTASAHGGTVRHAPARASWTLHASIAATERYAEIDLRSDGTYVEHGGLNSSDDVDCTGQGRLTAAMFHVIADAIHQARARTWRSAYGVYADTSGAQTVAVDSAATLVTPEATPPALEQAYLRLSTARREYRTMVEFAHGAYRNDAPPDLVRVVNALTRPLTLCRPFDGSRPG